MKLFSQEVKDNQELQEVLQGYQEVQDQYKVAVILYAFDNEGRIIFQRRGPGCSDERLKTRVHWRQSTTRRPRFPFRITKRNYRRSWSRSRHFH